MEVVLFTLTFLTTNMTVFPNAFVTTIVPVPKRKLGHRFHEFGAGLPNTAIRTEKYCKCFMELPPNHGRPLVNHHELDMFCNVEDVSSLYGQPKVKKAT